MIDIGTAPPLWPFSITGSGSPPVSSVPESQAEGVWWAERPPLAEEEPDFTHKDFNSVFVTSPPLKAPAGGDVEKKSSLTTDKPSPSDEEVPVPTLVTLFITDDDEESPKQVEPKEEPVSQTDLNWSDEDKITITDNIVSSLLRGEKSTDRDHR